MKNMAFISKNEYSSFFIAPYFPTIVAAAMIFQDFAARMVHLYIVAKKSIKEYISK